MSQLKNLPIVTFRPCCNPVVIVSMYEVLVDGKSSRIAFEQRTYADWRVDPYWRKEYKRIYDSELEIHGTVPDPETRAYVVEEMDKFVMADPPITEWMPCGQ